MGRSLQLTLPYTNIFNFFSTESRDLFETEPETESSIGDGAFWFEELAPNQDHAKEIRMTHYSGYAVTSTSCSSKEVTFHPALCSRKETKKRKRPAQNSPSSPSSSVDSYRHVTRKMKLETEEETEQDQDSEASSPASADRAHSSALSPSRFSCTSGSAKESPYSTPPKGSEEDETRSVNSGKVRNLK